MRIIQVIQQPQLRGAEIFACQLSNHLKAQGHKVLMVTVFKGDADIPFNGEIINLDRPLSLRLIDLKGWKKFYKIIQEFKPDIIQANASDTLKFTTSSKYFFSWETPLVYRNANKSGDFIDSRLKWKVNKFYIDQLDFTISVSEECEKDFIKTFQYPTAMGNTVEIGIEDKNIGDVPEDLQEIFQKGPVLTNIAGFVPEKNHIGLVNIFTAILRDIPDAQLILIGKGHLKQVIQREVKIRGIEKNVHFLGYRKDVLEILHHSRVYVMPSLIEGLPGVILEAMFCGTPVVANNVGGIGEVVKSGKTGWLIEKGKEEEFVLAVKETLQKDKKDLPEVKNAKTMIHSKFLNEKIAKRFYESYLYTLELKANEASILP
ncbi:glycosyltransferase family 4 protein [Salinimicrobium sp. HB62]|uniref:glycosyltransferase family 4 protein n=1 Tax=Salinimicrobium sp. HB62 TaxID=3077781 RepID=UPI002D77C34A|nr:glycosyltransferase family 4 protein [Salinimicrobium sp. HB62]